jgi:alkylation response protein AidB-like acyl-CoA dehydrogenase
MADAKAFREEIRGWLAANCPAGARGPGPVSSGGTKVPIEDADTRLWLERCAERGFTVPTWPRDYGGAGFDKSQYLTWLAELRRIGARSPLAGMGTSMIGPTLLEFGSEEQKRRHLPRIARGEVRWCQGYSEPSSGSDLASLRTRAVDHGDHFVINGQKIWTTGAQYADWIFCLVRTDPEAPKHDGISFVLFTMDQPGVRVRPIRLISGASPFCETFFTDAIARKEDLVHGLNRGWTVAKRLLQHERSGISRLAGAAGGAAEAGDGAVPAPAGGAAAVGARGGRRREAQGGLLALAASLRGDAGGRIGDPASRETVLRHEMNQRAFQLTQRRTVEETDGAKTPGPATSIFKFYGANLAKERAEIVLNLRGFGGLGWEGEGFSAAELAATRGWLGGKAGSIAGGTNEVQLNIIAKRVLGLPD